MITPNLATRPFLNTRPVWLVSGVAAFLAVVLIILNLRLMLVTSRALEDEIANRDALEAQYRSVAAQVRNDVEALTRVPWRSLEARVAATNTILRQQLFSWPQMLDDIAGAMPYDVRLTRIAPSVGPEKVTLSLEVVARRRCSSSSTIFWPIRDSRIRPRPPSRPRRTRAPAPT